MKKYDVRLSFFSGFYESFHDSVLDSEIDMILEDYEEKEFDDFRFDYDYEKYCKNYVEAISKEIGLDLKFKSMWSPREYNFATDEITCEITTKELNIISSALNSQSLIDRIKERFTSRDGFISFYSKYINDWKEKPIKEWDEIELGTLLDAWIIENYSREYWENLDYLGYEFCSDFGQYVDYELLVDGKTQKEIDQEEYAKLEKWNKSVLG